VSLSLLVAAGLGLALGVVTGMPLGVVNCAIVEAASAGDVRYARSIGLGGAVADLAHATLAFIGLGQLVVAEPAWTRGLAIAAAVIVVAYAAVTWRRAPHAPERDRRAHRGFAVGLALTLPNPGALAAWVAVAAAAWPDIAPVDAVALGAGVGVGSAVWFAVLASWVARRRDHRAVRIAARAALAALVALAAVGVARTFA
jgi:threonine/homoserine/homoserine lactone efflux protein